MAIIKFLKITLPVTTATSATIATTLLVSSFNKKKIEQKDLDNPLNDFELPDEKYEDTQIFYSKDGEGDGKQIQDKDLAEELSKLLKEKGNLDSVNIPTPDLSKLNLDQVVDEAPPSQVKGNENNKDQQFSSSKEERVEDPSVDAEDSDTVPSPISPSDKSSEDLEPQEKESVERTQKANNESIDLSNEETGKVDEDHTAVDSKGELIQGEELSTGEEVLQEQLQVNEEDGELQPLQEKDASSSEESSLKDSKESHNVEGKENLTQEEINKWKDIENQVASVTEMLGQLIII